MSTPTVIQFVSSRGTIYDVAATRRIVLGRIAERNRGLLREGWRAVVTEKFADAAWLRFRNGMIPGALVSELETVALSFGR